MVTFTWFRAALCGVMVDLCLAWCSVWGSEPTEFPAAARQRYDKGRDLQEKGRLGRVAIKRALTRRSSSAWTLSRAFTSSGPVPTWK